MSELSELSMFLKKSRSKRETTATLFWEQNKRLLGVSYEAFKHYENGTRAPSIDYLRRIAPLIGSDFQTLCHLWARAHMPDEESRSFFKGVPGYSLNVPARARPEEIYRFSRSDIKYLQKHPQLYMVAVFMAAYYDSSAFSVTEIMRFAELPKSEALNLLRSLEELGVVHSVGKDQYRSKFKVFDIPRDDEMFKEVRDRNYVGFGGKVLKAFNTEKRNKGEAQRFTFTTRFTPETQRIIQSKISELESYLDTIPAGHGERLGTVCVAFSDYVTREGKNS